MSEQNAFFQEKFKHKKKKIEEFLMKTNSKFNNVLEMKLNQQKEE